MVPSGEGANLAIFDGAELGKAIAAAPGNIEAALASYQADLFTRSAQAATEAAGVTRLLFGAGAPYGLVEAFERDMMRALGS